MFLEFFEHGRAIKCGVECVADRGWAHDCPYDAVAIAHFKNFGFDGQKVFAAPKSETIISICATHQSRLKIKARELDSQAE